MDDNKDYIEGIYNYCDRWCERCKYTDRCYNFQMQVEAGIDPLDDNIPDEKVWEYVSQSFAKAMDMIKQFAAEEGIDLDTLPEVEEPPPSEKATQFKAAIKPTYDAYLKLARAYFEENQPYFALKADEFVRDVELGIADEQATIRKWREVLDKGDIIKQYMFFMGAKIDRAISGIDDMHDDMWESPEQSDANRTARILMTVIERSIASWEVTLSAFPEKEETILKALSLLAKLHRLTENAFPRWAEAGPDVEW
jgi:hypothetical protein